MDPILAGLLLYLALMIAVGFVTYRYMNTLDDYVLAGRRLGPWVAAISERASGESAWFLLGLPGAAYALGFTEYWSVIGIAAGILASWTFIAIPLRRETARLGALTLPDYFELRFGDRSRLLRIVSMVVILFFYTIYVAAQLIGAGKILHATFELPHVWGIVIGAAVVVFYTLMGGFLAVAWTDLIQGLLMTAVAVLLPLVGIFAVGGPAALMDKLAPRGPDFLSLSGGQVGAAFFFGVVVGGMSWGLGYMGQPHLLTRYMAIRKTSELRQGGLIAMGWTLVSYWGAPMIGIIGVAVLGPDLDRQGTGHAAAGQGADAGLDRRVDDRRRHGGDDVHGRQPAARRHFDAWSRTSTCGCFGRARRPRRLVLLSRLATVAIATVAFGWPAGAA